MIKEKYYIPEIEEFHVGFEYEDRFDSESEFENKILIADTYEYPDYDNLGFLQYKCKSKDVRVKYLNKEDVESLGFICTGCNSDGLEFQKLIDDYLFYDIDYNPEDNELIVEKFYQSKLVGNKIGEYNSNTLFQGIIKNKFELKVLLKQLG